MTDVVDAPVRCYRCGRVLPAAVIYVRAVNRMLRWDSLPICRACYDKYPSRIFPPEPQLIGR